jgi:hypothetical protein
MLLHVCVTAHAGKLFFCQMQITRESPKPKEIHRAKCSPPNIFMNNKRYTIWVTVMAMATSYNW